MGFKVHDLTDIYLNKKNRNVAFKAAINIKIIKKLRKFKQ